MLNKIFLMLIVVMSIVAFNFNVEAKVFNFTPSDFSNIYDNDSIKNGTLYTTGFDYISSENYFRLTDSVILQGSILRHTQSVNQDEGSVKTRNGAKK